MSAPDDLESWYTPERPSAPTAVPLPGCSEESTPLPDPLFRWWHGMAAFAVGLGASGVFSAALWWWL